MKKLIIKLTALAAVAALLFTLTGCGGLSGAYVSKGNAFDSAQFNGQPLVSVEFSGFNDAKITTSGWTSTTYKDGSYSLNGNQITLKAEWNYTDKWEGTYSYRQSGDSIFIDNHEYSKR